MKPDGVLPHTSHITGKRAFLAPTSATSPTAPTPTPLPGLLQLEMPWYVTLAMPSLARHMDLAHASVWTGALEGSFESDPERAKQLFLQHIARVQATVPAEKLLVFEVSQGWGPLSWGSRFRSSRSPM